MFKMYNVRRIITSMCILPFSCWLVHRFFRRQPGSPQTPHPKRSGNSVILLGVTHECSASGNVCNMQKKKRGIFWRKSPWRTFVEPVESPKKQMIYDDKKSEFDADKGGIEIVNTRKNHNNALKENDKEHYNSGAFGSNIFDSVDFASARAREELTSCFSEIPLSPTNTTIIHRRSSFGSDLTYTSRNSSYSKMCEAEPLSGTSSGNFFSPNTYIAEGEMDEEFMEIGGRKTDALQQRAEYNPMFYEGIKSRCSTPEIDSKLISFRLRNPMNRLESVVRYQRQQIERNKHQQQQKGTTSGSGSGSGSNYFEYKNSLVSQSSDKKEARLSMQFLANPIFGIKDDFEVGLEKLRMKTKLRRLQSIAKNGIEIKPTLPVSRTGEGLLSPENREILLNPTFSYKFCKESIAYPERYLFTPESSSQNSNMKGSFDGCFSPESVRLADDMWARTLLKNPVFSRMSFGLGDDNDVGLTSFEIRNPIKRFYGIQNNQESFESDTHSFFQVEDVAEDLNHGSSDSLPFPNSLMYHIQSSPNERCASPSLSESMNFNSALSPRPRKLRSANRLESIVEIKEAAYAEKNPVPPLSVETEMENIYNSNLTSFPLSELDTTPSSYASSSAVNSGLDSDIIAKDASGEFDKNMGDNFNPVFFNSLDSETSTIGTKNLTSVYVRNPINRLGSSPKDDIKNVCDESLRKIDKSEETVSKNFLPNPMFGFLDEGAAGIESIYARGRMKRLESMGDGSMDSQNSVSCDFNRHDSRFLPEALIQNHANNEDAQSKEQETYSVPVIEIQRSFSLKDSADNGPKSFNISI